MTNEEGLAEQEGLSKGPQLQPEELFVKSQSGRTIKIRINFAKLSQVLPEKPFGEAKAALTRYVTLTALLATKNGRVSRKETATLREELRKTAGTIEELTGIKPEALRRTISGRKD